MVMILKSNATNQEIQAIEKALLKEKSKSGFDAKKHNGKLHLKEDPLHIQHQLRNEWERNSD